MVDVLILFCDVDSSWALDGPFNPRATKVPSAPEGPLGLKARGGLVLMVLRGSWSLAAPPDSVVPFDHSGF